MKEGFDRKSTSVCFIVITGLCLSEFGFMRGLVVLSRPTRLFRQVCET